MVSKVNYIFCIIIVLSDINRYLCEPPPVILQKQNGFDIDGIINSFFPNLNQGDGNNGGESGNSPPSNNVNQANSPQGNSWNNANANPGINYPGNSQLYPGQNSQGVQQQYPDHIGNNGIYPGSPQQGVQQQYPDHIGNNGIYPGSPQQANQAQYPGNMVNDGVYPGSLQQGSNNQRYPGNNINGNLVNNPGNANFVQGNNPQYPGNNLNNNNNPNYQYPGNSNALQGINPQYPTQGNGLNHINTRPGINYPTYPSDSNQGNYVQYPGTGNNWNNNRYPGNYQNVPPFNAQPQGPFTDTNWNKANGLQNNPNQIGVGNQQAQGFIQNPIIQGQPPRYPDGYPNYNPGSQNGFPSQEANGLNNQLNGNFQDPNRQYPQLVDKPIVMPTITPLVTSTTSAMKQCVQDCPATSEYNPVCGNNNITYFNKGKFDCARRCGIDVKIIRNGACAAATGVNRRAGVYA